MFRIRKPARADDLPFSVNPRRVNIAVGAVALFLPLMLGMTTWLGDSCFMISISHFYYSRIGGDILVGALSIIGIVLILFYQYKGGEGPNHPAHGYWTSKLAKLAGLCALGVAYFPTSGVGCRYSGEVSRFLMTRTQATCPTPETGAAACSFYEEAVLSGQPSHDFWGSFAEASNWLHYLHYGSAALMFLILAWFSLVAFTWVQTDKAFADHNLSLRDTTSKALRTAKRTPQKRLRNGIYRVMGGLILLSVIAMGAKAVAETWVLDAAGRQALLDWWNDCHLTFWFETLALVAFGVSWSVKGRMLPWLNDPEAEPVQENA